MRGDTLKLLNDGSSHHAVPLSLPQRNRIKKQVQSNKVA